MSFPDTSFGFIKIYILYGRSTIDFFLIMEIVIENIHIYIYRKSLSRKVETNRDLVNINIVTVKLQGISYKRLGVG